jgi:hypothetical protein
MNSRASARPFQLPITVSSPAGARPLRSWDNAAGVPAPAGNFDREAALREQRGLGLAAMGLVSRHGDRYVVASSIARNVAQNSEVRIEPNGHGHCTCFEFAGHAPSQPGFQCEHLLAVKHAERMLERKTAVAVRPLAQVPANRNERAGAGAGGFGTHRAHLFDGDPCARSFAELVAPRQLGLIRQLARETGIDSERECRQVLDCATRDLSKEAAAIFIDYLDALPRHTGESSMQLAS